jgi:hypothetical protein
VDLAVAAGALRRLLSALQGLLNGAQGVGEHSHPLVLVAQLQQLLLGLGRKLDPGGDRVGGGVVQLTGLGALAALADFSSIGGTSSSGISSTSPAGYSWDSKRSSTLKGASPLTTMFMRPSSNSSRTSATRAVQPIDRAPSSSRSTIPNGSP